MPNNKKVDLSNCYTKAEIDNLLKSYAKSTSIPDMSSYLKKNAAYHLYDYINDKEICIESSSSSGIGYLSNGDPGSAGHYTAFYLK